MTVLEVLGTVGLTVCTVVFVRPRPRDAWEQLADRDRRSGRR